MIADTSQDFVLDLSGLEIIKIQGLVFELVLTCGKNGELSRVITLAAKLELTLYQGGVYTTDRNADLQIKPYGRSIPGFPEPKGNIYRVYRALNGCISLGWNRMKRSTIV